MFGNSYFGSFTGFNLIESREMVNRVTKVYKTTRKWKKHGIHRQTIITPKTDLMVMGQTIIGHPIAIQKLRQSISELPY